MVALYHDLGAEWRDEQAYDLVIQPDDRIVIAGSLNPSLFDRAVDLFLARFTANGALDATFGDQGVAIADFGSRLQLSSAAARALLLQLDGRLTVAGDNSSTPALARFDSSAGGGFGGVLSFRELSSYPPEDEGTITVAVRRTGGATGPASVNLRLAGSDFGIAGAAEGCDFTLGSATLTWASGDYAATRSSRSGSSTTTTRNPPTASRSSSTARPARCSARRRIWSTSRTTAAMRRIPTTAR